MTREEKSQKMLDILLGNKQDALRMMSMVDSGETTMYSQADKIIRLIREYFKNDFAVYENTPMVFTGKIWEPIDDMQIRCVVDDFLAELNINAKYRSQKFLYVYLEKIKNVIYNRILKPDMSIMCFKNCIVNFNEIMKQNRGIHEFSPEFDCIKCYDFNYDRTKVLSCHTWLSFLGEECGYKNRHLMGVLPEPEKRNMLQMFLGAALVDRSKVSFEYFMFLQGTGSNGKSVIAKVLRGIFGDDEIIDIKPQDLLMRGDDSLRSGYAMMNKRFVYCTETPKSKNSMTDNALLKAMSSGESVAVRGIGKNIEQMKRPPIIMCNSNYKWTPEDLINKQQPDDMSMQRRMLILNFDKTIPVECRDTHLSERLLDEKEGIFAWIVLGLCKLMKNEYKMPEFHIGEIEKKMMEMRADYTSESGSKVAGSIVGYLRLKRVAPSKKNDGQEYYMLNILTEDVYQNYATFCERNGMSEPVSMAKFSRDMTSLGYLKKKFAADVDRSSFEMYTTDEEVLGNFRTKVPSIAEECEITGFKGKNYTTEQFLKA